MSKETINPDKLEDYLDEEFGPVMLTRTIGGVPVTLEAGQRYRATRSIATNARENYPVTVYKVTGIDEEAVLVFGGNFTREQANEALAQLYQGVVEGIYFTWREE